MQKGGESSDEESYWECTMCLQPIVAHILQCKDGHLMCKDCNVAFKEVCPTCGNSIDGTRNRALEKLRDRHLKKVENERVAANKADAAEVAQKKLISADEQKAEDERIAAEKAAAAAQDAEKRRIAAERKLAEQERIAAEKEKAAAKEKAEEERAAAKKKAEEERAAAEMKKAEEEEAARVARENARLEKRRLEEEARERKKAEEEEASRVAREKARLEKKRLEEEEKARRDQEKNEKKRRKDEEEWKRKREREAEREREKEREREAEREREKEREKERKREAALIARQARDAARLERWQVIRQAILRGLSQTGKWNAALVVLLSVIYGASYFLDSRETLALIAGYGDTFWQSATLVVGYCAVTIMCWWLACFLLQLRGAEIHFRVSSHITVTLSITTEKVLLFAVLVVVVEFFYGGGFEGLFAGYEWLMAVIIGAGPRVLFLRQVGALILACVLSTVSLYFIGSLLLHVAVMAMLQAIIRGPEGFGILTSFLVLSTFRSPYSWHEIVMVMYVLVAVYLGPERFMALVTDSEGPLEFLQYEKFVFGHIVRVALIPEIFVTTAIFGWDVASGFRQSNFLFKARELAKMVMLFFAVAALITPDTSIGHVWALVADESLFWQDAAFLTGYCLAVIALMAAGGTNYWLLCMVVLVQLATSFRGALGLGLGTSVLEAAADGILVKKRASSASVALLVVTGVCAILDGKSLLNFVAFGDRAIMIGAWSITSYLCS